MNKFIPIGIVILIILIISAVFLLGSPKNITSTSTTSVNSTTTYLLRVTNNQINSSNTSAIPSPPPLPNPTTSTNTTATQSNQTLFNQSSYYPYSYLIAPGNMSASAKQAFTGHTFNGILNQNGSESINITIALNGKVVSLLLPNNYKLYFIEKITSDDTTVSNSDYSTLDDSLVVVNATGYIVQVYSQV